MIKNTLRYFRGVVVEMKRVRWLSAKETTKLSSITLLMIVLISTFTFVIGILFTEFTKIMQNLF